MPEFEFPLGFYLTKGWRSISDAAYRFETAMRNPETLTERKKQQLRADMLLDEKESRECYAKAAEIYGWGGDIDATIAEHWATYLPSISAADIVKLRAKAEEEREGRGGAYYLPD